MAKYIYNCSGELKTYQGIEISDESFYLIPDNLLLEFASNSSLLADLATQDVKMSSDGEVPLSGTGSEHIDFLKNLIPPEIASMNYPFADKKLPNGKKLFNRVHGVVVSVQNAPDNIDFVVPYTACKITGIEIINGVIGDKANFKVLDTPTGTVSGTPNAVLNQFGFNVNVAEKFYERSSKYDADLIQNMKLRIEYDAKDELLPRDIHVNFILHEVV